MQLVCHLVVTRILGHLWGLLLGTPALATYTDRLWTNGPLSRGLSSVADALVLHRPGAVYRPDGG